jgi:anti-anti-sigma regulatory factor
VLRCGKRRILLDLAEASDLDAAGLGELVRVYRATIAANGVLRIANPSRRIREMLVRVGLFDLLNAGAEPAFEHDLQDVQSLEGLIHYPCPGTSRSSYSNG